MAWERPREGGGGYRVRDRRTSLSSPLGALLSLRLTVHWQARRSRQVTFLFTIKLALSMPVCRQAFPLTQEGLKHRLPFSLLTSGLTDLPQAHLTSATLAHLSDHFKFGTAFPSRSAAAMVVIDV